MRTGIRRATGNAPNAGVALLYAVFGTFVVASMVSVMFTMAGVTDRQAEVKRDKARARLLADGALDAVETDLETALAHWRDPLLSGTKSIGGHGIDFEVLELGNQTTRTDPSGIVSLVQPFELRTRAHGDGATAAAQKIVSVTWTPLFQFAVFYGSDLEIHAGPDLTLRGRVHSNGDMYLGGGSTITLDTNYVRAVGDMYRSRKHGGAAGGNVDIRKWVANPFDPAEPQSFERMLSQAQLLAPSTTGYDSNFTSGFDANGDGDFLDPGDFLPFEFGAPEYWGAPSGYGTTGQTVMTGQHGVEEAVTPGIGSLAMYEESPPGSGNMVPGYYHDNAGLSVIVSSDGRSFSAYDGGGNDVTSLVAPAITLTDIADMRQSAGSNDRTRAVEIDMQVLATTSSFPANGLIYAGHEGMGTGTEAGGVVLTNGEELPMATTVASPGSVYVQGDYNTIDKKGASVVGDSVNLLSNAWDGSKSAGSLPNASETTYNFAMITGSYESEANRYNGGLENLPRFHENWSGVPCNIRGSFVNIYDSQYATGDWVYGQDRYTAPIRNWDYDPDFNLLENLPPFTPMAVEARGVVVW